MWPKNCSSYEVNSKEAPAILPTLFVDSKEEKEQKKSRIRPICVLGLIVIFLLAAGYCPFLRRLFHGQTDTPLAQEMLALKFPRPLTSLNTDDWIYFNDTKHDYRLIDERLSFLECLRRCTRLDSYMISIHNEKENDFVYDLVSSGEVNENMWIGMVKVDGKFFNIDGSPVDYYNWYKGEHSTGYNKETSLEHCVIMYTNKKDSSNDVSKKWNNLSCYTSEKSCVCKRNRKLSNPSD